MNSRLDRLEGVAEFLRQAVIRLFELSEEKLKTRLLLVHGFRSSQEQMLLYQKGRTYNREEGIWVVTSKGEIVTNAKPWQSWHQYRRAIDAVPMRAGKPLWTYSAKDPEWRALVEEAEKAGLEWAGRWRIFKESVHFQSLDGLTMEQAKAAMVAVGFVPE